MARKTGLSIIANQPEPTGEAPQEQAPAAPAPEPRPSLSQPRTPAKAPVEGASRYAGTFHVGASYDENDDTVEAFRALAFKTRRKQKNLLHEAMQLLVEKYDPFKS